MDNTIEQIVDNLYLTVAPHIKKLKNIKEDLKKATQENDVDDYNEAIEALAELGNTLLPLRPFVEDYAPHLMSLFNILDTLLYNIEEDNSIN